jgi:hypothetical protein
VAAQARHGLPPGVGYVDLCLFQDGRHVAIGRYCPLIKRGGMTAEKQRLRAGWENGQLAMKPVISRRWEGGMSFRATRPCPRHRQSRCSTEVANLSSKVPEPRKPEARKESAIWPPQKIRALGGRSLTEYRSRMIMPVRA